MRQIDALLGDDIHCLDDEELDSLYLEHTYWMTDVWPTAENEPREWLAATIKTNPGLWTAEICRMKHDRPSDNQNIAWCGLCQEYANPRKRERDKNLPQELLYKKNKVVNRKIKL